MAAHTLVLLRHGKSDWSGLEADPERPLNGRGRRQAAEAGSWVAEHVAVDLAVVSPAERARHTWELASAELAEAPQVRSDDRVYAAAGNHLLELVRELPENAGTVVLVGHNPGLEDLAATLTGEWISMKTSALAVIELDGPWSGAGDHTGTLTAHGRPPED